MNYWLAETTNLSECAEPLFTALHDLSISGARTAKTMFGAGGWVCFHNFDLWRGTAPLDGVVGYSSTCGGWLTTHLWEHYLFTGSKTFLAQAYPVMKGAAQFFADFLKEEPEHHWLVTNPATSPEHQHAPNDSYSCAGSTFDEAVIRDVFAQTAQAAQILGVDAAFRQDLLEKRACLAPYRVGIAGQLQEWMHDWDTEAPDQQHRHLSHLYGLFPSHQITPRKTPELAQAAIVTLNTRGDESTGWATAWRINCWARLHDGERAHQIVKTLLAPARTYPNLFDAHPPFQIDGNFGGTAGMTEMLLQSDAGEIELLPALPKAWPKGSIKGLRARGGFEIEIAWQGRVLTAATIRSVGGTNAIVRYGEKTMGFSLKEGGVIHFDGQLQPRRTPGAA